MAVTNYLAAMIEGFQKNGIAAKLIACHQVQVPFTLHPAFNQETLCVSLGYEQSGMELVRTLLEQREDDTVFTCGLFLNDLTACASMFHTFANRWIAFFLESPYVTYRDDSERNALFTLICTSCNGLIVPTSYLKQEWAEKGFPPDRILVSRVPTLSLLFPPKNPHHILRSALYVGNLMHQEVPDLLEITALVHKVIPDFHLTIIADGTKERISEVRSLIRQQGLKSNIHLQQPVDIQTIAQLETAADILLLPRRSGEFSSAGFPSKLGEYLMSGTPVVCTDTGDISSVISDKVHAYLVPPDNPPLFAKAVIEGCMNPDQSATYARQGANWARSHIDAALVVKEIVAWADALS